MLTALTAFLLSSRGLVSLFIILIPNWAELRIFFGHEVDAFDGHERVNNDKRKDGIFTKVAKEDLSLRPHLNSVLRAEILFYTTQVENKLTRHL